MCVCVYIYKNNKNSFSCVPNSFIYKLGTHDNESALNARQRQAVLN